MRLTARALIIFAGISCIAIQEAQVAALHRAFSQAEGIPDLSHKVGPHAKSVAIVPGEDVPTSPTANDQQFVQYPIVSTPFGWHIASAESMQHGFYKLGVFSLIACLIAVAIGLVGALFGWWALYAIYCRTVSIDRM